MNNGWIKLHRKSLDSTIFQNDKGWKVWCWCLMKANHRENNFLLGRTKLTTKSGQFIMGSLKASEQLDLAKSTIWYWLDFLESEGQVGIKKTNKYSIITIKNWDKYQEVGNKSESNEDTDGKQIGTNKNDIRMNKNIVSANADNLSHLEVKYKTKKEFTNAFRGEKKLPPITPRTPTEKQKEALDAFKAGIEYFKQQGSEQHGMMFLEVQNEKRNAITRKLVISAQKLLGDLKPLVDWWFIGNGEWAGYEPEQCFATKTIEKFKNSNKIKPRQGSWDSEKIKSKKQGIWKQ